MNTQKTTLKTFFISVFVGLNLLLFFLVFNPLQKAYAESSMFEIKAIDYQVGTWATEDVVVIATPKPGYESGNIFYSISNPSQFLPYDNQVVVNVEGAHLVYFKFEFLAQNNNIIEEYASIEIKLDKTPPLVSRYELSENDFTTGPVSVRIFLANSSVNNKDYRAIIFQQEYLPLEEFVSTQIVFELITERNTVLNIGDITIFDQANNKTVFDQKIVVDNIDNIIPDFHLNHTNTNNKNQIEIKLGYIHSQAKEIMLIYPSGKTKSLPIKETQSITANESGTYIVRVVSTTDKTFTRGVLIENSKTANLTFLYFVMFVIVLSGLGIAVAIFVFNKNKNIKIIKKSN